MPESIRISAAARHYAKAIFELAVDQGEQAAWSARLDRLAEALQDEVAWPLWPAPA